MNKKEHLSVFFTTHYMEEADRVAQRVAIIDHGKIIASGTPIQLKEKTKSATLEDAFLVLTGTDIRADNSASMDGMRIRNKLWNK